MENLVRVGIARKNYPSMFLYLIIIFIQNQLNFRIYIEILNMLDKKGVLLLLYVFYINN